ncbi:MAG TPA: TIGR03086 family protein, partial [Nocardioides sp.]
QMFSDLVVHGWDLARAIGAETDIAPDVAEHAMRFMEPYVGQWPGVFADPVATESDDPTDRMVAMYGRDPAWRP